MKTWIRKTAKKGVLPAPVPYRPWQESVDEFDLHLNEIVDQESDNAVVELWLEDPRSFLVGVEPSVDGEISPVVRRVKVGGLGLRRYDPMSKVAASNSWDEEFQDAKNHAAQVLSSIGITRR